MSYQGISGQYHSDGALVALLPAIGLFVLKEKILEWMDASSYEAKLMRTKVGSMQKKLKKKQWRAVVKRLKGQGLIEDRKLGDRVVLRLTDEGIRRIWIRRIQMARASSTATDLCFVIFDVPEKEKVARDTFRYFLKSCNFKLVQRSVWACPSSIVPELVAFVKYLNLQRWVRVIKGKMVL